MEFCALSFATLLDHNAFETGRWRAWLEAHPAALEVPCDIIRVNNVGEAVQHIFAVELRYAERLADMTPTDYAALPSSGVEGLFEIHERSHGLFSKLLSGANDAWLDEVIELQTRTAGAVRISRRNIVVHAMLHSMRHWAQLAVLLRHAGMATDWPHDFLFYALKH